MRDTNSLVLEDKIRIQIESSRARLTEFFIDYDRLRSGYVTKTQFRRVLDQIMKTNLTEDEVEQLINKYDTKNNSAVNYRLFCNVVNKTFPENDLNNSPDMNIFKNPEYLGTFRSMKNLDSSEEVNLQNILEKLSTYFSRRNIDILVNFRDFDRNNIGVLTESQFRRCISTYSDVLSADDMDLIQKKYQHPERKGSISYLNFYNDIYSRFNNQNKDSSSKPLIQYKPVQQTGLSVQEIIDRISIVCYKNGLRISDFFKDFDRLRSGVITERQFSSALIVGLEKAPNISPEDIYQLAEYYRQIDGRVEYRSFCDNVENAFNVPDMEKKPLANVRRPPQGLLAKTLNGNLTPYEEDKVSECLKVISDRTRKYKLQLFTYFKDYDRSSAFTRSVTKLQFGRVLSTLNLMPDTEQFALLCKKFEDSVSGDVNYPLFCQAVDDEYVSAKIEDVIPEEELKKDPIEKTEFPIDISDVDINEVIARIRSHALSNRLRIKEFFQDMDPLNSGSVTRSQFIRCMSSFGVSSLGGFPISRAQCEVLCNRFQNAHNEKINWKRFEEEIESVFTVKDLEKSPNLKVISPGIFIMPPQGTVAWDDENLENAQNYKTIIEDLKQVVKQRRLDCWPPFRDYDKLNRGHVTNKQFYQSLNKIGLKLSDTEIAVLEAKFTNKSGFNYRHFLEHLQPIQVEKAKYNDLKQELDRLNTIKPVYESNPLFDVQSILIKVRDQVFKRRVSIYEWLRDHDKLNSGRLLKETFKRAIDLCNLDLQPSEIELLINYFSSQKDDRMVEYKEFCVEVEKAFSDNQLEKNPLLEAEQHLPKDPVELNVLLPDEIDKLNISLERVAQRVRTQRIQLFPRFEDFDRIKNGYVTRNQFLRVLNDLSLAQMLSETELAAVLKKFSVRIGSRDDVNYVKFSDSIYSLGNFEFRLP